jgi:RNA-directed DNA polymerase
VQDDTTRMPTQGWLPLECESDLGVYNLSTETPTQNMEVMERIVAPSNIREAYRRVKRNDGCPGVDGMTVEELLDLLRDHWQQIRKELLDGTYTPSPVKRLVLPKPGGGIRVLGIPTVLDRLIQQAVWVI